MQLPRLEKTQQTRLITSTFRGLERRECPDDSQFYDMTNLSSDLSPVLGTRKRRGAASVIAAASALGAKDALVYVDGSRLVYNGVEYDMTLSTSAASCPKQLVSMGAYIIIFPDKKYFNTADVSDRGNLNSAFTTTVGNTITLQLSTPDGTQYEVDHSGDTAPEAPQDGDTWLDSSEPLQLKRYSASSAMWVEISSVYVKIIYPGIGTNFFANDGVKLSGFTGALAGLNGYNCIHARGDGYVVVTGLIPGAQVTQTDSVRVSRECPDMDFVCEAGNRLWGCRYGFAGGRAVNELYCSALGDFRNWTRYQGISTDSWAAGVGSDGVFTAAASYRGSPLFFKEDCMHKVYISPDGAHRVHTVNCRGVKRGCARSVQTVDEFLLYLSPSGVCAYDGSLPVSIGDALCGTYSEAAAGSLNSKYYISMKNASDEWAMYVYDLAKNVWHREDDTHALFFAQRDGELYYIDSERRLVSVTGTSGTPEPELNWEAISGVFGYGEPDRKYLSRFSFCLYLPAESRMNVYVQYDSSGEWELVGSLRGEGTRTFSLPVIPRRCDHLRYKLSGVGEFRLYSFSRILETGSDENCR